MRTCPDRSRLIDEIECALAPERHPQPGRPIRPGPGFGWAEHEPTLTPELSAAEAYGLLYGAKARDTLALRFALKELVARGGLRAVIVEEERIFGWIKRILVLARAGTPLSNDPFPGRTLEAVLRAFEAMPGRSYGVRAYGVTPRDLAKSIFPQYRQVSWTRVTRGFAREVVLPTLEERGLLVAEPYRRFGVFNAARWTLTQTGAAEKAAIQARLATVPGKLDGELRALAARMGQVATIDAAFKAIDAGVDAAWDDLYGD